jgi:hypothetical protein
MAIWVIGKFQSFHMGYWKYSHPIWVIGIFQSSSDVTG